MEPRSKKHKKTNNVRMMVILITIGLLIMLLIQGLKWFSNDNTVSFDDTAQETLSYAISEDENTSFHIDEKRFQEMMHHMTHQKVNANLKYGSLQLSEDNVKGMLVILKQNKYKHRELYSEILNKWKNNDFSDIVKDHNEIRKLLDEQDGRAISKMNKKEEDKFIKENFKSTE